MLKLLVFMKTDAIEKLFKMHYNEVKLYVYSLCHNASLAEDIASESFYRAIKSIDEERDGFKYWLLRVARNAYYDYLKKAKREVALDFDIKEDGNSLVSDIIKGEEYRALYSAINLLGDSQRELVVLFYFESMRVNEISKITGLSEDNVKVTLFRARQKLKQILEATNG